MLNNATTMDGGASTNLPLNADEKVGCQALGAGYDQHEGDLASLRHFKLTSFAELARFRHLWGSVEASVSSPPPIVESRRFLQLEAMVRDAEEPKQHRTARRPRVGFIAFVLGPKCGFVSSFGTSVLSTTFRRTSAWVFPDRQTLRRSLYLALGLNHPLFEIRVLPASCGTAQGAQA